MIATHLLRDPKVVVVGAGGTIGQPVVRALSARHEVVRVGPTRGDNQLDISSRDSIARLYEAIGDFDALVCAEGKAAFAGLEDLTDADFELSVSNKLMGQVNLVRLGATAMCSTPGDSDEGLRKTLSPGQFGACQPGGNRGARTPVLSGQ